MAKKGVLLINLGSPDSTEIKDVKKYLRQFLMDPRVINSPTPIRWFVVNCLILPKRPKNTAEAYKKVWKAEGSPLILTSQAVQKMLFEKVGIPVELGMTYGNPSIPHAIRKLKMEHITDLYIIPLYPHYAMSSYETAVVAANKALAEIAPEMRATYLQPFYKDQGYIEALVKSSQKYLDEGYDHLLFSFHGIPESHLKQSDPSHSHCLTVPNCCETCSPSHSTCYKHQCLQTVKYFVEKAKIPEEKYSISFQSRLGREPWLTPYTDEVLEMLPKKGVKRLLVICPAFVSDCLETIEEISMEGKESFLEAGGESFDQIPCLNEDEAWINYLESKVNCWMN